MIECIILIGLPGAGKTTFYLERFAHTHILISKDLLPNARDRDARQQRAIEDALVAGHSIVVDNTNVTTEERRLVIELAHRHGATVVGYFFDVSTRAAVARNSGRQGRAKVPNVAIFTGAKRLQAPTCAEAFDSLFRVTLTPDGAPVVQPIDPTPQ